MQLLQREQVRFPGGVPDPRTLHKYTEKLQSGKRVCGVLCECIVCCVFVCMSVCVMCCVLVLYTSSV